MEWLHIKYVSISASTFIYLFIYYYRYSSFARMDANWLSICSVCPMFVSS